jgi:hypothetical protein
MAKIDNDDLKAIKDLIEVTVDEVLDNKEVATVDHLGDLPTKDEFYGKMDEVMGELRAVREEIAILGHQVSDQGDRIERIESDLDISSE